MASSAKRRMLEPKEVPNNQEEDSGKDDSGSDEDSEEDSVEYEEEINTEIKVDFEAHGILDQDYDGIKKLVQQLFLKAKVNTAELTDIIIQQNHIGSIIKQADVPEESDDDEDDDIVYGFISLFHLTERQDTEVAKEIKELILSKCQENCPNLTEQLEKILNDNSKPVGLLLCERFVNMPPQVALPMHKQLQKELTEAQRTNKPCGKCHYFLLISRTFIETLKTVSRGNPQQKELKFINAEEEFFYEQAVLKFNYSVKDQYDSRLNVQLLQDAPREPLRTVMLVPVDKLGEVMDKLTQYLSV